MNLYNISEELLNFQFNIDEETGEILNINDLDNLQMAFNEKAENIIKYIKNLDSECAALKKEEEMFAERRKAKEKKINSLKNYLSGIMMFNGTEKLEFTSGVASFRKSKAVEILDESVLGKDFLKEKVSVEYVPDKKLIKETIESGTEVLGAILTERKNLNIK